MADTVFHDGRTIEAVWWGEEGGYKIGMRVDGSGTRIVTRINPLAVSDRQGAFVPWLEVFAAHSGDPERLHARVNLANVEEVVYGPPA